MKLKKIKNLKKRMGIYRKNAVLNDYYHNLSVNENLIFLESKNGNDIAGNIFYLIKELNKSEYDGFKIVLSLKNNLHDSKRSLLKNYGLSRIIFTETGTLEYYKYLYSAKYLFSDATFPPTFVKKPDQVYLNTWHGTPLKNLGKANAKRGYGLGNVQRNFVMADYLLYPNPFMEEVMIRSFMLENLSGAQIMNEGYPRNTIFFDEEAELKLKSKIGLQDKQIIVYMPTWRGVYTDLDIEGQNKAIKNYLSELDGLLSDDQLLYVKLHTVVKDEINYGEYEHIQPFPQEYETYDVLNMADCLITDYSSVFFDYACSRKKIILFVYDEEEYLRDMGTYFSLDDLPFPRVYDTSQIIEEINTPKNYDDAEFLDKFCKYDNPQATKNICEYVILNKNEDILLKNIKTNGKENILIYTGNLADNYVTDLLKDLLDNIDLNERNYFLTFRASQVKNHGSLLYELSQKLNYIPLHDNLTLTTKDAMAARLFFKNNKSNNKIKKQLDQCYKRNLTKYYPSIKFDKIIHFSGADEEIINLFESAPGEKTILVYENTILAFKNGKNHKLTLKQAYQNYDNLFILKKELLELVLELSGGKSGIIVCENDTPEEFIRKFESLLTY